VGGLRAVTSLLHGGGVLLHRESRVALQLRPAAKLTAAL